MYKKNYQKRTAEEYKADKKAEQDEMFAKIADDVLEELKKGKHVWQMPWLQNPENGVPENGVSKHQYDGNNFWLCLFKQYEFKKRQMAGENIPNPSGKWYTFAQIKEMNIKRMEAAVDGEKPEFIHVRKGEHGTTLIAFVPIKETEEEKKKREEEGKKRRQDGYFKAFTAFNSCQIDGLPHEEVKEYSHAGEMNPEKEKELETFFANLSKNLGVPIRHKEDNMLTEYEQVADRAYYSRLTDTITIPPKERFRTLSEYYGTLFHEFAHSTGAEKRLGRLQKLDGKTSNEIMNERAQEEIIAEFTSCYMSQYFKTAIDLSYKNNVGYMGAWKERLQDNRDWLKEVLDSSSKAVKLMMDMGREKTKKEEKTVDLAPEEKQQKKEVAKSI